MVTDSYLTNEAKTTINELLGNGGSGGGGSRYDVYITHSDVDTSKTPATILPRRAIYTPKPMVDGGAPEYYTLLITVNNALFGQDVTTLVNVVTVENEPTPVPEDVGVYLLKPDGSGVSIEYPTVYGQLIAEVSFMSQALSGNLYFDENGYLYTDAAQTTIPQVVGELTDAEPVDSEDLDPPPFEPNVS